MQAIVDWLEKLGMSEYTQRFAENRIDLSVLPDLTDQDLEKLGVVLGDRRKMLRAIRELSGAVLALLQPAFTEPKLRGRWAERSSGRKRSVPYSVAPECRLTIVRRILRSGRSSSGSIAWTTRKGSLIAFRHSSCSSRRGLTGGAK
jgi:SAM domain (Sterile alpha motif)